MRPITARFVHMSVDGRISPGASDTLDADRNFPKIDGVKKVCTGIMKLSKPPIYGR